MHRTCIYSRILPHDPSPALFLLGFQVDSSQVGIEHYDDDDDDDRLHRFQNILLYSTVSTLHSAGTYSSTCVFLIIPISIIQYLFTLKADLEHPICAQARSRRHVLAREVKLLKLEKSRMIPME